QPGLLRGALGRRGGRIRAPPALDRALSFLPGGGAGGFGLRPHPGRPALRRGVRRVSAARVRIARLDEIPIADDGRVPSRIIRHHLGIQAFGINAWLPRGAGESAINDHDEADTGDEELYLVLKGHAVFTIDGEEVDAPEGTLVFVEPDAKRSAVAKDEATTILAVGAPAGRPYKTSG